MIKFILTVLFFGMCGFGGFTTAVGLFALFSGNISEGLTNLVLGALVLLVGFRYVAPVASEL